MKKVALSLATVLAAAAFAPEASAIPSFARQTGMACSACHYQHYPVLNGFGQAFKASGYTIMGTQGKVEGEHLSIPDTLNASILLKAMYVKTNGAAAGVYPGASTNNGAFAIPDEISLFFGGRIGDSDMIKIGFMNENNMGGSPMVAGLKLPIVIDLGAAKVMAIPFATDGLGMAYGYEESSTGLSRGVRWGENRKEISAANYVGVGTAASGFAFVLKSDIGYINVTKWGPLFTMATNATSRPTSTWLRVAATPTIADWAMHIGVGVASGTSQSISGGGYAGDRESNMTVIDFQGQGAIAAMPTSVYVQTATAPKSEAGKRANLFNGNSTDTKATTIGAEVSVVPDVLHLGFALRNAKKADLSDNATTVMAVYDLFQNVGVHIEHSMFSGDTYSGTPANGKTKTTFLLEAAW